MPAMDSDPRQALDALAQRAERRLRGWAWRRALEAATPAFFPAALALPLVVLATALLGFAGASPRWPFGVLASVCLALAAPVLAVLAVALARFLRHRAPRQVCLALYDHGRGLRDRLQTADEFAAADGGFERAAVEDAAPYAARALAAEAPPATPAPAKWSASRWPLGVAGAAALALGLLLDGRALALGDDPLAAAPEAKPAAEAALPAPAEEPADRQAHRERRRTESRPPTAPAAPTAPVAGEQRRQRPNASPAASQSAASQAEADARAASESQAQVGASGASGQGASERREPPDARQAARKPRPNRPRDADQDRQDSSTGIADGKGGSSGSRIATSDHPPVAAKTRTDDADNDVEDLAEEEEDEEQKAGSSHRPMVNNRKAPVDRTLTPSANSDQERDDLNGRGGPGGLKKTRGVAAMLLGVPAPDHLRGKPNPGRVKVQRERAEPEEKHEGLADAAPRGARDEAFGAIAHPNLAPWMQDVVRGYFLARNNGGRHDSAQQPPEEP